MAEDAALPRARTSEPLEVEALLGTGAFGQVYRVRSVRDGGRFALKTPRAGSGAEGVDLLRDLALRAAELKGQPVAPASWLDETPLGSPGLILPLYAGSLLERLREGPPVREVVAVLARAARIVASLEADGQGHGNLRAANILVDEAGTVVLADPLPARCAARGAPVHPSEPAPLPPEGRVGVDGQRDTVDTYALGAIFYQAVRTLSRRPLPLVGPAGVDTPERRAFEEAIAELLAGVVAESYRARIVKEAVALVSRAASRKASPSPPYRYLRAAELAERFERLARMFRPEVAELSVLRVELPPGRGAFRAGEKARFGVIVSLRDGVDDPGGLEVFTTATEVGRGRKIAGARVTYTVRRYATGRLAYHFEVEDLPAGTVEFKVAFRCAGSTAPPKLASARCHVEDDPRKPAREPADDREPPVPGDLLPEWRGDRADGSGTGRARVSQSQPSAPVVPPPSAVPPPGAGTSSARRTLPSGTPAWAPVSAGPPDPRASGASRRREPPTGPDNGGEGGDPPRSSR